MSENGNSRHVSFEQVKSIIDFMGQHVEFASGCLRSLEARHTSKRLWGDLTKILNSCRGGTRKTSDGWSKYWSDFKNKLKNKSWLLKKKKAGSASKRGIKPLTKLERRALVILGPYFGKKSKSNEYEKEYSESLQPPEVKLESYQEIVTNEFSKVCSKANTSDRLLGVDDRSNDSEETSGEEYIDGNNPSELNLQNIYPKWLIEVEKTRADAELIRAKAEQQTAAAATKNAEAAIIQAEALKKLAESASVQAQAILRIAALLENRGHGEDILAV